MVRCDVDHVLSGREELDFSKNKPADADLAAKQAEFLGSGDEEDFEAEVESLSSGSDAEEEKKASEGPFAASFETVFEEFNRFAYGAG